MNSYATEQLTRQRHDQFAREAHRDLREAHRDRLAQSATPLSRPSVGQSPVWRLGGALVAAISRPMHQRRSAKDSPISSRATSPRQA
jgi:hypothetical protein